MNAIVTILERDHLVLEAALYSSFSNPELTSEWEKCKVYSKAR